MPIDRSDPADGSGRRRRSAGAILFGLLVAVSSSASVAETRFAVIAPIAGNPFYEEVASGCRTRATAVGGASCLFFAPGGDEKRGQAEIVADLAAAPVGERVAGIAVSPAVAVDLAPALAAAGAADIPVIAFDADLPEQARRAFVGTDARDFGRALGSSLRRWKPAGGRYAILTAATGGPALLDRVDGVRDALGSGWTEIPGSPVVTDGEAGDAANRLDRLLVDDPSLDAVVSVGAWPFLDEGIWREIAKRHKERLDRARTVLVLADALPSERALVRDGLGHVLVGQRPAEMGARIVDVLDALAHRRAAPEVVYVGFDVFTRLDLLRPTQ
jgi:ribose transport system substrate-binding protein